MAKSKTKYYVVWVGVKPGIYTSWDECKAQIANYPKATYKSFKTKAAAEAAFQRPSTEYIGQVKKTIQSPDLESFTNEINMNSIAVDAACSGNPGVMEYRGVITETGRELFRKGPYEEGTNNVGEFLALIHALALLKKQGRENLAVYSDSRTAMSWLRKRKVKTTLKRSEKNKTLFVILEKAIVWMEKNSTPVQVLKWDTERWGEIPADFGRK